jgi:23S rRNA pseudouridine1911/1915/1917 synthase
MTDELEPEDEFDSTDDDRTFVVPAALDGERVDRAVALMIGCTRAEAQALVADGDVHVNGRSVAKSRKLVLDDVVTLLAEPPEAGVPQAEPEVIVPLRHTDEHLYVIAKPAGLVVHPAGGHPTGTLVNGLLALDPAIGAIGDPARPGIVHRLDRDTSGVIVVARSEEAHHALARQFERRTTAKTYLAITQGAPRLDRDEIDMPIGIHPYQREKMAVRRDHATSREAVTRYEVLERFRAGALVRVTPKTGRTHQIRVHLAAIGCPVLCDGLYSGRTLIEPGFLRLPAGPPLLERQALHAASLEIDHPASGERLTFSAPLPADLERMLAALRSVGT